LRAGELGFLLLTSQLGNPERRVLTTAQLRTLASRVRTRERTGEDRELGQGDLAAMGYSLEESTRILALLEEQELLEYYLHKARRAGCVPVTRVSEGYPLRLRKRLGEDSPGCLWAKGDLSLLDRPGIALVGSRELRPGNREFAREAGRQAAAQGYVLISGNARGADKTAQEACLEAGGRVICVVADRLDKQKDNDRVLYLSESGFDSPFSAQRALSRNRVIHSLGALTLLAQSSYQTGGSWDGTVRNLRFGWTPVFGFGDGSPAMAELEQMGVTLIGKEDLADLESLKTRQTDIFGPI